MKIGGLQRTSLIDFPDCVSAVVFLQGCNFRCPYCHNPSLVLASRFGPVLSDAEFFGFLEKRRKQLDGVVVTGGEPTVHRDLREFIIRIRELGYAVKLDTNGSNPDSMRKLIEEGLLDYVAMDLKGDPDHYPDYCGVPVSGALIRESVGILMSGTVPYEFRTTAVPGLHDLEGLKKLAELVCGADLYAIQVFRPGTCLSEECGALPTFDAREVRENLAWFRGMVKKFELRGDVSRAG